MESFYSLIKKSYTFRQDYYDADSRWKILEELYNKNFLNKEQRNYDNLPKKIHQIWIGCPFPDKYKKWANTWKQFNPDWEYKLWTDKDLNDIEIPNRELFDSIKNAGQKSDFLRYHILNQFGGMYVDTDFECLKSFDSLTYVDFLVGIAYGAKLLFCNGLICSIPNHPILEQIIHNMDKIRGESATAIFETTGSVLFTRIFFKIVTEYMKGIVTLPHDYLYPFPNNKRHLENGKKYIKDCSYAIHYWKVSWLKK
jgi:mannosyltransferase OCH1-like enzyme